jgi:hypothetical protein
MVGSCSMASTLLGVQLRGSVMWLVALMTTRAYSLGECLGSVPRHHEATLSR